MLHRTTLICTALLGILVLAATAAAHADIADSSSAHGAKARLTVTIEHGCTAEGASVNAVDRVAIALPAAFGKPVPQTPNGWRAAVSRDGGAYRVVWSHTQGKGFTGRLTLTAVNPAKAGTYAIPTVQYCGSASIAWIEKSVGGVEADHPVPTVSIR